MALFNRATWFPPKGEPTRKPRNIWSEEEAKKVEKLQPTIDEETARAAQELLESHALERVFDRLRAGAMSDITTSVPGMTGMPGREDAYARIRALDAIRDQIQAMADELKLHRRND